MLLKSRHLNLRVISLTDLIPFLFKIGMNCCMNRKDFQKQRGLVELLKFARACLRMFNSLKKNFFPFMLSGDHSSAVGTISGIKAANPSSRIGVIWIDAHADLHSPFTTPSGNVHGMTLMALLNQDNYNRRLHELDHLTSQQWDKLKKLDSISPKIHVMTCLPGIKIDRGSGRLFYN